MRAAVDTVRGMRFVGLNSGAQKFLRRFIGVNNPDNFTTGTYNETIRLDTWKPREPQSHIMRVLERVQVVMPSDEGPLMLTYLDVEYKCGCREEMFRWRGVANFDEDYDRERGLMRL